MACPELKQVLCRILGSAKKKWETNKNNNKKKVDQEDFILSLLL